MERSRRLESKKHGFFAEYKVSTRNTRSPIIFTDETEDLKFWLQHCSWTYCQRCGSLERKKLLPSYRNRSIPKALRSCSRTKLRYALPLPKDVPLALRGLTYEEILVLRPLQVFCGPYQRKQHGYRVRTGPFDVRWHDTPVLDRIHAIQDPASQHRVRSAYNWLMETERCRYKNFVAMQQDHVQNPWLFEIFSHESYKRIEAALWLHLYYHSKFCESYLEGSASRESSKVSFAKNMCCGILAYSLEYKLLHYHYDRWLFKTVTGAINTAAKSRCSPAKSLETKTTSAANRCRTPIWVSHALSNNLAF